MSTIPEEARDASTGKERRICPVKNATETFWRRQPHTLDEHRSTDALPVECDIAIIGTGMSGVATAYYLSLSGAESVQPSIVLLEARQVCSGATGRNGGHIKLKTTSMFEYLEKFGPTEAQHIANMVHEQMTTVKHIVELEKLDCEFELRRSYDVFLDKTDAEQARTRFEACSADGQPWIQDVSFLGKDMAAQATSVKGAEAAFSVPACSFSPYKFVTGLLGRLIEREAVNLQTNTPVMSITTEECSGMNMIETPRGLLKAKKLVYASNGYTAGISRRYVGTIIPCAAAGASVALPSAVFPRLSCTYNINHDAHKSSYVNPRPDGTVVVGGGKWLWEQDRSKWYNVWDDSVRMDEVEKHYQGLMEQNFPGWTSNGKPTIKTWTGIIGTTSDGFPHIGEVPGKEGLQWIIAGFNGFGMLWILVCASAVSKLIKGECDSFAGTGLPRLFETTRTRTQTSSKIS